MPSPISSIRNIGPASEAEYIRAGIPDAETLRDLGPDAAYAKLLAAGSRPHFIAYYAMVMGLAGRPWNDCKGAEKTALRARFDRIVAANRKDTAAAPEGIEHILDQIGLPAPKQRRG
ncbi:MAG: competence protein TfoX [Rhodobacterales bacterium]|nr:MAG: competence protein TfoX [Rhodobacterales bacterium]